MSSYYGGYSGGHSGGYSGGYNRGNYRRHGSGGRGRRPRGGHSNARYSGRKRGRYDKREEQHVGRYRRVSGGRKKELSPEEEVRASIENLMVGIGDRPADLAGNVVVLADALEKDVGEHKRFMLETLMACVKNLATKTYIYGALVGLLTSKNPEFGKSVISQVQVELSEALAQHRMEDARFLLRFVGELMNANVVGPAHVASFMQQLVDKAAALAAAGEQWHLADHLVYLVLSVIPFAGLGLSIRASTEFGAVWDAIVKYMEEERSLAAETRKHHALLRPLNKGDEGEANRIVDNQDWLQNYFQAVRQFRADSYKSQVVLSLQEELKDRLARVPTSEFQIVALPSALGEEVDSKEDADEPKRKRQKQKPSVMLRTDFRLFWEAKDGVDEKMRPIDRVVLSDHLSDLMSKFADDHKQCAKFLLSVGVPFEYYTVLVETLFSRMFTLPSSREHALFYAAVVIDLFNAQPSTMPRALGRGVNQLYLNIQHLDIECRDRLAEWFSLHLSNFKLVWAWPAWAQVVERDPMHPQRLFCADILARLVRLSYWSRVRRAIPDKLEVLMPPQPAPAFRFAAKKPAASKPTAMETGNDNDDDGKSEQKKADGDDADDADSEQAQLVQLAQSLIGMFRRRVLQGDLTRWLEQNVTAKFTDSSDTALRVLFPTLLMAGAKSYSHITVMLQRYGNVIKRLNTSDESQFLIVKSVGEFWQHSPQHVLVILGKLVAMGVVDSKTIVSYVFGQKHLFHSAFLWQLLQQTVTSGLTKSSSSSSSASSSSASSSSSEDLLVVMFRNFAIAMERNKDDAVTSTMLRARFIQFGRMLQNELRVHSAAVKRAAFADDAASGETAELFEQLLKRQL